MASLIVVLLTATTFWHLDAGSGSHPPHLLSTAVSVIQDCETLRYSFSMRIALFEPEIAGNVGAVLRLAACLGAAVDLIEPMGFEWDDRRVRRTAMDYIDHVVIAHHLGFDAFRNTIGSRRLVLFTTKSRQSAYDFSFTADDVLLFGKASAGVPPAVAD